MSSGAAGGSVRKTQTLFGLVLPAAVAYSITGKCQERHGETLDPQSGETVARLNTGCPFNLNFR